jgi:hypothetical protein
VWNGFDINKMICEIEKEEESLNRKPEAARFKEGNAGPKK